MEKTMDEEYTTEKILSKKKNYKPLIHLTLILGAFLAVFPFFWMIVTSFKTVGETMEIPPTILPSSLRIENYFEAWNAIPFKNLYLNTVLSTLATVVGQVAFCSMAGYAFARIDFKGKNIIFVGVLSILMVPSQIFIIPQFDIISDMGLVNTVTALFLPNIFSAFGTFLMRQYFLGIPDEIEEAAVLDGANRFTIFFKIMLPLVKPGLTALIISSALFAWNTMLWPLIVNTNVNYMTLSAGLASFQGQHTTNYPVLMAGAVLATWPMIVVFILFQKQFTQSIANTGSKS